VTGLAEKIVKTEQAGGMPLLLKILLTLVVFVAAGGVGLFLYRRH
jgi:hypothetical protein